MSKFLAKKFDEGFNWVPRSLADWNWTPRGKQFVAAVNLIGLVVAGLCIAFICSISSLN